MPEQWFSSIIYHHTITHISFSNEGVTSLGEPIILEIRTTLHLYLSN